jgi:hypothetical protein
MLYMIASILSTKSSQVLNSDMGIAGTAIPSPSKLHSQLSQIRIPANSTIHNCYEDMMTIGIVAVQP